MSSHAGPGEQQCRTRRRAAARTMLSVSSCRTRRRAAGAERDANRELSLTRRAACEQEVRDVDARDEQHEADGRAITKQRGAHRADHLVANRNRDRATSSSTHSAA